MCYIVYNTFHNLSLLKQCVQAHLILYNQVVA